MGLDDRFPLNTIMTVCLPVCCLTEPERFIYKNLFMQRCKARVNEGCNGIFALTQHTKTGQEK